MNDLISRRRGLGGEDTPVFVDWIQNTGQEYILFPYKWNGQDRLAVHMDFPVTSVNGFILGSRTASKANDEFSLVWYDRKTNANIGPSPLTSIQRNYTEVVTVFGRQNNSNSYYIVEQRVATGEWFFGGTKGVHSYASTWENIAIFGCLSGGVVTKAAFPWKFKKLTALAYGESDAYITLSPCFYRGEYGLWHVETKTFYGNASGQGAFIGGYDE